MRLKFLMAMAAVVMVGAVVVAQQPGQPGGKGRGGPPGGGFPGGFGGGGFASRMSLLRIPEVRKELELADDQIKEIEKADEEIRAKYPTFGGRGGPGGPGGPGGGEGQRGRRGGGNDQKTFSAPPADFYFVQAQAQDQGQGRRGGFGQLSEEDRAKMEQQRAERAREERAKLADILLPEQMKRLTEIYVQVAGVAALQDDEIAKEIGISDAQKKNLAAVQTANREAVGAQMRELFQGGGGGDRDAMRTKMEEIRKSSDAKVLAVLTPDQQKKFEAMKGKAFAMPEGGGRGGPGGGRGRGTPGGNNN